MRLNELRGNRGARQARKRVGRGIASGKGRTAGRGNKGQKSRSGTALKGFEGGQMPIYRRLPWRGFNNKPFANVYAVVNLGRVQAAVDATRLDASKPVTIEVLEAAGLVGRVRDGVRLLAKGKITSKLAFEVTGASKAAIAAVEKVGGTVKVARPAKEKAAKTEPAKEKGAKAGPDKDEAAGDSASRGDESKRKSKGKNKNKNKD